jgi:transposase
VQLAARIEEMDRVIQKTAKENEACQRLTQIPGVGPVTATALIGAIGNASAFGKGRALAAWMGIVPGEHSSGGKQKLLGISKRGNKVFAKTLRARRTQRLAAATQASSRPEGLACATAGAHTPECGRRGIWPTSWFAWPGRSYIRTNAIVLPFLPCQRKFSV